MAGTGTHRVLVGRDEELRAVLALVRARTPVVTVTGAPGVGKSALVAEVARRLAVAHTAEVCALDLAADGVAVRHPEELLPRALGEWGGAQPGVLVVTVEGADLHRGRAVDLASRLGQRPGVVVLVPAVSRLRAPGEGVVQLHRLRCVPEPGKAEQPPAVRMFLACAAEAGAGFSVGDAQLETIGRICLSVEGLPAAIARAADLSAVLPLSLVEAELADADRALGLLSEGSGGTTDGLGAALERASRLLDQPARRLLTAASAFSAPVTAEAVAAVAGDGGGVSPLAALTGTGLVTAEVGPDAECPLRFRVPRLVRAYVRQWPVDGETSGIRQRHAQHVAGLVAELARRERSGETSGEVELAALRGDVLEALSWTEEHAPHQALRLATELVPIVLRHGDDLSLFERMPALVDSCLGPDSADGVAADTLVESAQLVFKSGRPTGTSRALAHLEEGLRRARAGDDPFLVLHGLVVWIQALYLTGDFDSVVRAVDEGYRLALRLDDQSWLARYEAWRGMVLHVSGDVQGAIALGIQSLARARRHKDDWGRLEAGLLLHPMDRQAVDIPGGPPTLEELYELSEWRGEQRIRLIVMSALAKRSLLREGAEAVAASWLLRRTSEVVRTQRWNDLGFSLLDGALLAGRRGDDEPAARWHGALTPVLDAHLILTPPGDAPVYTATVDAVAARLGPEAFDAAIRAGARTDWPTLADEILQYAEALAKPAPGGPADPAASLTDREREVLALVAAGSGNKDVAQQLGISAKTVMHHTVAIYRKLGVRGRGEAAVWAVRNGLA